VVIPMGQMLGLGNSVISPWSPGLEFSPKMRVSPTAMIVLPKFCPGCGQPFSFGEGLCGERQLQAIALQTMRSGVELSCRCCGIQFVVGRTAEIRTEQRIGGELRKPDGKVGSRIGTR